MLPFTVRVADQKRPAELLDAIASYLVRHGIADLSLRPLARAVGSSPRGLLYPFGSKQKLIARAIARLRERQRVSFSGMRQARYDQPSDACLAMWQYMSAPQSESLFKFFLETYALALRDPKLHREFLRSAVEDWIEFIAEPWIRKGHPKRTARAFATVVLAGFRGFLLDYCASQDRERIDPAVDLWLRSLDMISPAHVSLVSEVTDVR